MRLTRLRLAGFRNLRDAELEFPPEGVALVGRNAQGKSNFLEAVHYLETFRSFRASPDERLVREGGDFFRLSAELEADSGRARRITAAFQASTHRKKVTLDGEEVSRLGDAIGRVGSVLFTPDDVRLISDGPKVRRRFLDVVLSLNEPGYLAALQRFRDALSQRNAALKNHAGSSAVHPWDSLLARAGAEVTRRRAGWIEEFSRPFGERYLEASGERGACMRYDPDLSGAAEAEDVDAVETIYRESLAASRDREARRRTTLVGPHRDDLTFLVVGSEGTRDLREYGSGGERRTAALALRLAEAETLRSRRGEEPVLLLDDVFAELDEDRSARVMRMMDRELPGQVVLTAPKETDVRFRGDTLARWTIEAGEIRT